MEISGLDNVLQYASVIPDARITIDVGSLMEDKYAFR